MHIKYLNLIKQNNNWFWNSKDKVMYLICTDDLDSLMSCLLILMYRPNWQIGGFFDYREGLYHRLELIGKLNKSNTIWVDCSSIKQDDLCISNHLTSISGEVHNSNDINLNIIDKNNRDKHYFSKYNLSTFLLLVSLLEHEIDNHIGRILSLCFDSSFKAYYQPSDFADAEVQKRYLVDVLELEEIYSVQDNMKKENFTSIVIDQNLNSKVYVSDEGIRTIKNVDLEMICKYICINTDLSVLDSVFGLVEKSKIDNKHIDFFRGRDLQNSKITSFAITNKDNVSFSYRVN